MKSLRTFALLCLCLKSFGQCSLTGIVRDGAGNPIRHGVVKVYQEGGTGYELVAGIVDKDAVTSDGPRAGSFRFGEILCANLKLRADVPGYQPHVADITGASALQHEIAVYPLPLPPHWPIYAVTLVIQLLFGLSLLFVRWHNIAKLDQKMLAAEAAATKLAIHLEVPDKPDPLDPGSEAPRTRLLNEVDEAMTSFRSGRVNWFDVFFWTRGSELAAWARIRDIQRQIVLTWDIRKIERIRARLSSVEQQLRTFKDPAATAIADQIRDALKAQSPASDSWKQLLAVGLGALTARREEGFAALTSWQTKGSWLAFVGQVFIAATVIAKPEWAVLFLMGGVGGLLSRLARALRSDESPSDYGASWTTLFLSPVCGALAGWFGFLLVLGFVDLNVLSSDIKKVLTLDGSTLTNTAFAFAFVLGFSERLFEGLVSRVDSTLISGSTPIGPATGPSPSTPAGGQPVSQTSSPASAGAPATAMPSGVVSTRIDHVMSRANRVVISGVGLSAADVPPDRISLQQGLSPTITFTADNVDYDRATVITLKLEQPLTAGDYLVRIKTKDGRDLESSLHVA